MLASLGQNLIKSIPKKLEPAASLGLSTQGIFAAVFFLFLFGNVWE